MSFENFLASLGHAAPPEASVALQALWYDRKGDWERAHLLAQSDPSRDGAWVHAYLHRKEGDDGNAGYWYLRAARPEADTELATEWEDIVRTLLKA